ncbi:MAG: chitobiase/beta-hexosaminidase C-terminal domain-containing protein [Bacteroidaceae bacterium]|nr:chitobiase/beta-hexosaminidase C-terminal domain-containing protein [Bacteroidaceae bacterium]
MKRKLLKALLAVAVLCVGAGNVWGDERPLYSQNFESFAVDADFNTVSGYWEKAGANVQKIVESNGNKYLTYQTSNGSTRNAAINFNISGQYSAGDNWTVSFDASLAPGNTDGGMFLAIVGENGVATGANAWDASTGNLFSVKNSGKSSTSYTVSVGGYTLEDALTLTSGSNYHYVLNWDGSKINLTITKSGEASPALSVSKDYTSSNNTTFGNPKAIFWVTTRYYGTTNLDNILVSEEVSEEVVSTPSISSSYAGSNRTVTIVGGTSTSGNSVTTYYTTDGSDPTTSNSVYSEPLDITSNCTVKAISISSSGAESSIESLAITVGKLTLVTPTISASGFTNVDGVYVMNPTFSFASNNSAIEGTPDATLSYTFTPDGGAESTPVVGSSFTPTTKGTLKVIASAENYNSSEKSLIVSNGYTVSYTGRDYTTATNADGFTTWGDAYSVTWAGWADGLTAYLSTTSFTEDWHLNIQNPNTISLVIGWGWVRGDQKTYGYRVRYIREGDFVALKENTSKGADANAITFQTTYCSSGTGAITNYETITVPASYAVQQLYHYSPAIVSEADLAILDCKRYETSAAFATAVATESFASAAEAYAFHTSWQIAQAKANGSADLTKLIRNAAVADATDWGGSSINHGEQFTSAPDEYYIDKYNGSINTNQTIYGVPAGTYKIKAATRAAEGTSGTLYVNDGNSDIGHIAQITNVGNTGGDLGNGWSYQEMTFTLTSTKDLLIGFWADASSNKWAGCDDWHMELVGTPLTISSAGWATLYTPYALDFSDVAGLTAYTASCDGSTVTLTEVDDVPANTGVVLKGDEDTYSIPVIASSETAQGDLAGSATEATAYDAVDGKDLYMLALNAENKAQFTKVTSGSIAAGKAYLPVTKGGSVKAFNVVFNDNATGIGSIDRSAEGRFDTSKNGQLTEDNEKVIFNLVGQRLQKLQKGVNIVNGKKVLVK